MRRVFLRFDEDIYGLKTANAVKRFQAMCGMTADGIYWPKTKMKISVKETGKIRYRTKKISKYSWIGILLNPAYVITIAALNRCNSR